MSEEQPKNEPEAGGKVPLARNTRHIEEVRYSLKEMMEEVREERKHSALGREMVDATEIDKMFGQRKRKKKKSS